MSSYGSVWHLMGFPGGSDGKNPPAIQETWIQSLGWEDPLENGMATHSSNLAWRIPWMEETELSAVIVGCGNAPLTGEFI